MSGSNASDPQYRETVTGMQTVMSPHSQDQYLRTTVGGNGGYYVAKECIGVKSVL